jgi:hypothetical protein
MTLRQAGLGYDGFRLLAAPVTYNVWDADRVHGCICDSGWFGADCSKRMCPLGDDPLITTDPLTGLAQVAEVQQLSCTCGGACTGSLVLSYAGKTRALRHNAVATTAEETGAAGSGAGLGESLESVLESLVTQATFATISFSGGAVGFCTADGNAATITFNKGAGDAPQLGAGLGSLASSSGVRTLAISTLVTGTTEAVPCSNRGLCDTSTGACTCVAGASASDGNGGAGSIPDCGYASAVSACPSAVTSTSGGVASICGGRGTCSGSAAYTCACYAGYTGPACEQVLCPLAPAWFDEPSATDTAHGLAECANRGVCNRYSGTCTCPTGFTGAACERTVCPTTDNSVPCSGNGRCLPLSQLAALGTEGGVPRGDLAVQSITCKLTAGTFTLSFQYAASVPLSVTASAAALKAALEALPTLGFVDVTTVTDGATAICGGGDGVVTRVTFTSELGPQPLLVPASGLGASGTIVVAQEVAGTRASYGALAGSAATWDADMLHGCLCDGYPDSNKTSAVAGVSDRGLWEGPACAQRSCPFGSDPEGPAAGLASGWIGSENQTVVCSALSGTFTLTFRGATTAPIPASASAAQVQAALEALPTVGWVSVSFTAPLSASAVCSSSGAGVTTTIRFLTELGDLPQMTAASVSLVGGTVATGTAASGTGTNEECSGRGVCGASDPAGEKALRFQIPVYATSAPWLHVCRALIVTFSACLPSVTAAAGHLLLSALVADTDSGLCTCFSGYYSSNGFGGIGRRGDCGAGATSYVNIPALP